VTLFFASLTSKLFVHHYTKLELHESLWLCYNQAQERQTDRHACHAVKIGAKIDISCCLYACDKHAGQSKQRQLKKDMCSCTDKPPNFTFQVVDAKHYQALTIMA